MRFCTELLPLLADHPGVTVEITGDLPSTGRLGTRCGSACPPTRWRMTPTGSTSGVTISVEGQEVPFADVFVALSRDQPYLVLA